MVKKTTALADSVVQTKYEKRQVEVLLAAAAEFAEKGYHGASTQAIADRLGMKQGSLYYYFRSKEDALEAVCTFGVGESVARLRQVVRSKAPLAEKIGTIIRNHIYSLQTHCDCHIVFTQQRRHLPDERREALRDQSREYDALLQKMFDQAVARGEMAADLDTGLAVRALVGLCNSVAHWFRESADEDIDHIASQYARLFFAGIKNETREYAS